MLSASGRILASIFFATAIAPREPTPPVVEANDNRRPAGVLRNDTLRLDLVVKMARWYPEEADGPFVDVAAYAEVGKAPQIPAPLIRVPSGTTVITTVMNELPDSVLWTRGLGGEPASAESSPIKPGDSRTFSFVAGAPGTFLYSSTPGRIVRTERIAEREQLSGALVVDPRGVRPDDRIFVVNIWGEKLKPRGYRNALAINGKSWPHTERIAATVGDSVRWRIVNGSARRHPIHLHGFYFRVDSRGGFGGDTIYTRDNRRLAVTEDMQPGSTMSMVWSPDRPGNWLLHCHLAFHVLGESRLDGKDDEHVTHHSDPMKHMAGLVIGIDVRPRSGAPVAEYNWSHGARDLRLYAQERPRKGRTQFAMSYVLQRGRGVPAPDSVELPGTPIILNRSEPTRITVLNRTHEATSVHWHGIELESYSDGVAGWSGMGTNLAPMIAPKDSFTARLTLPRSGTFIYHTHLNDVEQLTSGMYGPIIVLDPTEKFDPSRDHSFTLGWDGRLPPSQPPPLLINGDSIPAPLIIDSRKLHRLRFVNIAPAAVSVITLRRDSVVAAWTPRAKDGADLPASHQKSRPAQITINVGETFDAMVRFQPGEYTLTFGPPAAQKLRMQRIIVR